MGRALFAAGHYPISRRRSSGRVVSSRRPLRAPGGSVSHRGTGPSPGASLALIDSTVSREPVAPRLMLICSRSDAGSAEGTSWRATAFICATCSGRGARARARARPSNKLAHASLTFQMLSRFGKERRERAPYRSGPVQVFIGRPGDRERSRPTPPRATQVPRAGFGHSRRSNRIRSRVAAECRLIGLQSTAGAPVPIAAASKKTRTPVYITRLAGR